MFNRENLTIIGNSLKNGTVPSLFAYWNEYNDTVTTADFFNDRRLRVGDQIEVISADYSTVKFYVVSAVTTLAGTATVVASDLAMDLVLDDLSCDTITATGLIKTSGKIETTNTSADSIKTAGGGQFAGDVSVGGNLSASSGVFNGTSPNKFINRTAVDDICSLLLVGGTYNVPGQGGSIAFSNASNSDSRVGTRIRSSMTFLGTNERAGLYFETNSGDGLTPRMYLSPSGKLSILTTTQATTTLDGSLQTDGGLSVAKKGVFGETVKVGAYTLPATDGTNGQVLKTNGAGVLTWSDI